MTRDDMIALVRNVVAGPHQPSYCSDPAIFEPHEWVLEAMFVAYTRGRGDQRRELRVSGDAP